MYDNLGGGGGEEGMVRSEKVDFEARDVGTWLGNGWVNSLRGMDGESLLQVKSLWKETDQPLYWMQQNAYTNKREVKSADHHTVTDSGFKAKLLVLLSQHQVVRWT